MISNIYNNSTSNINKYYGYNKTSYNSNISDIINIAKSSYKNNTYTLYNNNNAAFIRNYNSNLTNLKELNSKLMNNNSNSVVNSLAVSSSNDKVLSANSYFTPKEKATYSINVKQIAQAQINTSSKLDSDSLSNIGKSTLSITTIDKTYSFDLDYTGKTNKEMLKDLAGKINKSNAGVFAIYEEKDKKSELRIVGDKTGDGENFTISGTEKLMLNTNLSNITQIAQDAVFDISKDGNALAIDKKSSTNDVSIDSYKVSATLKGVGQATVSVDMDKKKVSDAVTDFVSAYNSTINFLSENAGKGSGVAKQLDNLKVPSIYDKNLESMGIIKNSDGTLKLDEKKLSSALENDTENVKQNLSSRFGAFQSIDRGLNRALRESSIKLIDNSLNSSNYNSGYSNDYSNIPYNNLNLLNMYNRNGSYGLMNYGAMGLFLNMYI